MRQDIAAARVVMKSGASFVQLPCQGCVNAFSISYIEMEKLLLGKNALCDHLVKAVGEALGMPDAEKQPLSRVIWDVTAVAWLLNDGDRFMASEVRGLRLPDYDYGYEAPSAQPMRYVYQINRNALAADLFDKLAKGAF